MSNEQKAHRSESAAEIEREIRKGRKFTLADAIGQMAGPGALKGESPVARLQQASAEIDYWLTEYLPDAGGGLKAVLLRGVTESELLLNHLDQPLVVLGDLCRKVLNSEYLLGELVRHADIEWGRVFDETPYFQVAGSSPHIDDPYTIESVRDTLSELLNHLR